MDQLEERLDKVYRANTSSELVALLADLPARPTANAPAPAPVRTPASQQSRSPKFLVAFMSGVARRGQWRAPKTINALAFMGGVEIDLRSAELTSPVTEIYALAVMGGVEITVPPGVRVESDGFAIMGGFEDSAAAATTTDPNAPVIRLKGFALMGGVEVRVLGHSDDDRGPNVIVVG